MSQAEDQWRPSERPDEPATHPYDPHNVEKQDPKPLPIPPDGEPQPSPVREPREPMPTMDPVPPEPTRIARADVRF